MDKTIDNIQVDDSEVLMTKDQETLRQLICIYLILILTQAMPYFVWNEEQFMILKWEGKFDRTKGLAYSTLC